MSNAELIQANLPCSVEMPAGTGKTQLIAELARNASLENGRSLILTHTHAGVDAIRARLKRFGVSSKAVTVRTLDSWCFDLIGSFPQLSAIDVTEEPDWSQTEQYHQAGQRAVLEPAVVEMLHASYELVVVDEYQDCQLWQHGLVSAISQAVPVCVFGDRMQGLFFFGAAKPVDWVSDVQRTFPPIEVEIIPWRWMDKNPELGAWLLEARARLMDGKELNFLSAPVVIYPENTGRQAYFNQPKHPATVVAISQFPRSAAMLAAQLGGSYTMIEEIEGRHLRQFAQIVDRGSGNEIAAEILNFAVSCAFGVASIFPVNTRRSYIQGRKLSSHSFGVNGFVIDATNRVQIDPTKKHIHDALVSISQLDGFRLFRREAWFGVLEALELAEASEGLSTLEAVIQIRNKMRLIGRRPESRIVGRPLLVKGLEFDHAVISQPEMLNAHELYVCLTRGSRTVALVTDKSSLGPKRPQI